MHGDRQVSTKNTRACDRRANPVEPCTPEIGAAPHGYQVGGTSPFGTRKAMPVFVEETVSRCRASASTAGGAGYLVGIAPAVLTQALGAKPVSCAMIIQAASP